MQETENSSESDDYYDCTEKVVTDCNDKTSKKITKSFSQCAVNDKDQLKSSKTIEICYTEEEKLVSYQYFIVVSIYQYKFWVCFFRT